MTDAERLVACLRAIGFEAVIRSAEYREDFRGLAPPQEIRQRVDVGCHFLFDGEGKLVATESEYDKWVTSVCRETIAIVGYRTAPVDGLGSRVVAIDLRFRDATHSRKLLTLNEYHDVLSGRTVYVLPETPAVRSDGVVHRLRFRHLGGD